MYVAAHKYVLGDIAQTVDAKNKSIEIFPLPGRYWRRQRFFWFSAFSFCSGEISAKAFRLRVKALSTIDFWLCIWKGFFSGQRAYELLHIIIPHHSNERSKIIKINRENSTCWLPLRLMLKTSLLRIHLSPSPLLFEFMANPCFRPGRRSNQQPKLLSRWFEPCGSM